MLNRMFCGLGCSGSLVARGRSTLTECFITGTVMMKMISSTSMTSTSGVMLISFITSSVSSWVPKAISASLLHRHDFRHAVRGHARAGHEVGVQVMGEAVQLVQDAL